MSSKDIASNGIRVAFVIWKLDYLKQNTTFDNISKDSMLKDLSKEKLKEILKFLDDLGHIRFETIATTTPLIDKYVRTFHLTYPEAILEYAEHMGWITTSITINVINNE